ncbi:transcriptional regulator, TetR family [Leptospira ryugenii]|uniref:Transcriptional regulator, TetR family n=2 Tax=Leptospira ryugenii TaxID=1917863 RepID=A0A2P2E1V9_9LEPT|nr:transcriptional regulator, TetR family [Leptospira ryugenii]
MDEVAFTSKVAKGTLYLYFPTKEDLYLRVHILDYQHWFDDLKVYLEEAKTVQVSFPDWFVGSFDRHTRFLNSLPIVSAILEKNASVETIREFKSALLTEIHEILPEFTKALGFHSQDDAFTFLMQAHAFAIGAWSHCSPSENVKEVLKDNRFQAFQIDYKAFVKKSVEILLSGYR